MLIGRNPRRIKISHDPNNLTWSQSSASYGQKILASQGWKPGTYLGSPNAKHASHYGAGSASHIRITYKDDNLGLGAQSAGKQAAENSRTGLDAFQGLLGRLNGKSEGDIEKEQRKGDDLRLALYAKGRWGGMEFVRGGLLVQGKDFKEGVRDNEEPKDSAPKHITEDEDSDARSRRRKAEKKAKKDAKKRQEVNGAGEQISIAAERSIQLYEPVPSADEKSRGDRTERKKKKKRRKEHEDGDTSATTKPQEVSPTSPVQSLPTIPLVIEKPTTPVNLLPQRGRHILRGRHIQSKKMTFQDAKGLDEIFMRTAKA